MKQMTIVLLLVPLLLAGGAVDAFSKRPQSRNKWIFEFSPYFWMTALSGDIVVDGRSESIDYSASDMWDFRTWSMNVHVEGKKRNLSLLLDFKLTRNDHEEGLTRTEANSWRLEAGAAYQLGMGVEVLGGLRYMDVKLDVTEEGLPLNNGEENWVDPIVGLRYAYEFARDWRFLLRGDAGGFGVGSDLSWSGFIGVDYFAVNMAFFVGYRAWGVNYSTGFGDDLFKYDLIQSGLGIGLTFFL